MPPLATLDGRHDDLSRRRFLAAVTAIGLLTACSSDATSSPSAPATGPWTFTDDRGVTVSLGARPERIVSYETAGSALWRLGVKPVGIFAGSPLADSPTLAGLDVHGVEAVGEVYGEINLEKLAALQPDLIVTAFDPRQTGPVFGFTDADGPPSQPSPACSRSPSASTRPRSTSPGRRPSLACASSSS